MRLFTIGVAALPLFLAGSAHAILCNVPSATHATIQAASNDVACTEIVLAAGTYTEQVTIGRAGSIFLHGAGAGRTIIRSPAVRVPSTLPTSYNPNYTYVIQVPPGLAANIADLTVDGGDNGACGEPYFAVRFNNSTGSLEHVIVQNVRAPGIGFGCQSNISVAATGDGGGTASLTVLRSTVRNFQKVGILFNGTASGIVQNTVIRGAGNSNIQAQNGIQISRGASATLDRNIISGIHYLGDTCLGADTQTGSGIITFQAGIVNLQRNVLIDVDRGIFLRENTGTQTVFQNRVQASFSGIVSERNTAGVVNLSDNRVTGVTLSPALNAGTACFPDTGNGYSIINETGTFMQLNWAADAARDHIELFPTSTGGTIQGNLLTRGTRFDIENRGSGHVIGGNTCSTSSPAGLCAFTP